MATITPDNIIAILAIITSMAISIVSMLLSRKTSIRSFNKSFDNVYFDEIFRPFLIKDMAEILSMIKYENFFKENGFPYEEVINQKIQDVYDKSIPYSFLNKNFYEKMENFIEEFQNEIFTLIQLSRQGSLTNSSYAELKNKISKTCKKIYVHAKKKYRK